HDEPDASVAYTVTASEQWLSNVTWTAESSPFRSSSSSSRSGAPSPAHPARAITPASTNRSHARFPTSASFRSSKLGPGRGGGLPCFGVPPKADPEVPKYRVADPAPAAEPTR